MDANITMAAHKSPTHGPAIDTTGTPTTYLAYRILKLMFDRSRHSFTPSDLARLLAAKTSDTESICKGLKSQDILVENPEHLGHYSYNLNSNNIDVQTAFEKFLLDVELANLPVHLMLNYSPSFPYRPSGRLEFS